jgi:hypothetical protein
MYKNYINWENFNHNFVTIFLQDGKMESPMSLLFLGSGKMVLDTWWLHHGGTISSDHVVSPKGLSNEIRRHVTCNIQAQLVCYRNKRHLPLRDRRPWVRHANERPNWRKLRWDLKNFAASSDVTSLDSFRELVTGCRIFPLQYNVLSFSFKSSSKFRITRARAKGSKTLSFVTVQFTPGIYN